MSCPGSLLPLRYFPPGPLLVRCRRPCSNCSFTCLSSLQTVSALGARDRVLFFSVFPHAAQGLAGADSLYLLDRWVG